VAQSVSPRYRNALELACSVGVFTSMLAERCDALLAVDVSDEALARAAQNCSRHRHVRFEKAVLPHEFPAGRFDLITVCEAGYYFAMPDLLRLRERVEQACEGGAHVALVHWTPPVEGHAISAEQVHATFRASPHLRHLHGFTRETYRFDLLERRSRSAPS
jgi:SAM-dependent methyltransferase